jgi:hypothetical protein
VANDRLPLNQSAYATIQFLLRTEFLYDYWPCDSLTSRHVQAGASWPEVSRQSIEGNGLRAYSESDLEYTRLRFFNEAKETMRWTCNSATNIV